MAHLMTSSAEGIRLSSLRKGLLDIEEDVINRLINNEPIATFYEVECTPFARGKFATVKKCRHRESGIKYAAKFIRKRRRGSDYRQDIIHEIAVLKAASECSKIVNLHEVFESRMEMILVLELAAGGELQRVLDLQERLSETEAVEILKQILDGIKYLHDRNIAHLDIKPQNILLSDENSKTDIKLCDFGISRVIQNGVDVREIMGTPDYIAPEILAYEPICLETDIWTVGVLTYVLLTGYSPFGGESKQETYLNISQCKLSFPEDLFGHISTGAKDFISRTLVTEPGNRLTVGQCLSHPWLVDVSSVSFPLSDSRFSKKSEYQVQCLSCSVCKSIVGSCDHFPGDEDSRKKSAKLGILKPSVEILLNTGILC